MGNGSIDEDILIAIAFFLGAIGVGVIAMRLFRRGHPFWGIGVSAVAAVLLFVAYFFAFFLMRMF